MHQYTAQCALSMLCLVGSLLCSAFCSFLLSLSLSASASPCSAADYSFFFPLPKRHYRFSLFVWHCIHLIPVRHGMLYSTLPLLLLCRVHLIFRMRRSQPIEFSADRAALYEDRVCACVMDWLTVAKQKCISPTDGKKKCRQFVGIYKSLQALIGKANHFLHTSNAIKVLSVWLVCFARNV